MRNVFLLHEEHSTVFPSLCLSYRITQLYPLCQTLPILPIIE